MKKFVVVGLVVAWMSSGCGQGTSSESGVAATSGAVTGQSAQDCYLNAGNTCRVSSDQSSQTIDVGYPNTVVCHIELVPDLYVVTQDQLQTLANKLELTLHDSLTGADLTLFPTVKTQAIEYPFGPDTSYLAPVTVRTTNGEGLATFIHDTLNNDTASLMVIGEGCPGVSPG
jgi:hypothetical protein